MADEILEVNGSTLENSSQSEVIQYIYEVLNVYLSPKFRFTPGRSRGSERFRGWKRVGRFESRRAAITARFFFASEPPRLTIRNSCKDDKSPFDFCRSHRSREAIRS